MASLPEFESEELIWGWRRGVVLLLSFWDTARTEFTLFTPDRMTGGLLGLSLMTGWERGDPSVPT